MRWDKSCKTLAVEDLRTTTEEENMMEGGKKSLLFLLFSVHNRDLF